MWSPGEIGPEFWSRCLVELLLLQESRAGREGFLGVAVQASAGSFQRERRVGPIGKGRVGWAFSADKKGGVWSGARLGVSERTRGEGGPGKLRSWCLQPAARREEGLNVARFPSEGLWALVGAWSLIPGWGFQRLLVPLRCVAPGLLLLESRRLGRLLRGWGR